METKQLQREDKLEEENDETYLISTIKIKHKGIEGLAESSSEIEEHSSVLASRSKNNIDDTGDYAKQLITNKTQKAVEFDINERINHYLNSESSKGNVRKNYELGDIPEYRININLENRIEAERQEVFDKYYAQASTPKDNRQRHNQTVSTNWNSRGGDHQKMNMTDTTNYQYDTPYNKAALRYGDDNQNMRSGLKSLKSTFASDVNKNQT